MSLWICSLFYVFIFFFSSRRRHTRFDCDWSSDVCSSDLKLILGRLQHHASGLVGPLLFSAIFPVAVLYRRHSRKKLISRLQLILKRTTFERCVLVVAIYFWFAFLIAAATISKQGASDNYFLEMDVAACFL